VDGGTITVRANIKDEKLNITLSDDGPGFTMDQSGKIDPLSSGVGIANTKERLAKLYPEKSRFDIINRKSGGVTIRITLPCEYTTGGEAHKSYTKVVQ